MKKTQKKLGNKGFSLVELIVVIAIMAVLVGVLAPTLIRNVEKSRESKDAQNIEQIKSALEVVLQDETVYIEVLPSSGNSTLVTLSSGADAAVSGGTNFKAELASTMDVSKTKLTSKKYKGQTVKFEITEKGLIQVSGKID